MFSSFFSVRSWNHAPIVQWWQRGMMNFFGRKDWEYYAAILARSLMIHVQIASLTLGTRGSRICPGEVGVGKPVMDVLFAEGTTGQTARALSQSVTARSNGTPLKYRAISAECRRHRSRSPSSPQSHGYFSSRKGESGRKDLVTIAVFCLKVAFRHLGAGSVCGADKEDSESTGDISTLLKNRMRILYFFTAGIQVHVSLCSFRATRGIFLWLSYIRSALPLRISQRARRDIVVLCYPTGSTRCGSLHRRKARVPVPLRKKAESRPAIPTCFPATMDCPVQKRAIAAHDGGRVFLSCSPTVVNRLPRPQKSSVKKRR